jgi:hypothetical protein
VYYIHDAFYLFCKSGEANLWDAASRGKIEIVKALVGIKTDVTCKDQVVMHLHSYITLFMRPPPPPSLTASIPHPSLKQKFELFDHGMFAEVQQHFC